MKIQGLPVEYGCSDVDFKIEGSPRGIGKTWKPCLKCGRIALKYRQCAYYSHIVCTDCYTGPRDQDWCDECMDNFLALDVNIPESVYGQMKVTSPTFSGILSELKFRKLPNPPSTSRSTTAGYKTPFGPAPKTPGFPTTPAPSYLESNWKKGTRYSEPFDSDTDSDWDDCEWFDYYGFDDYYRKPIEFSGPLRKCPPLGRSLYPLVEESSFERNSYNDLTSKWNKSSSNSRRSSFRLNDFPKDGMSQYYNSFVPRPIAYSALPRDQKPPNFGSMSNPSTAQLKKHESVKPYFLMEQPNKKQTVDPVNTENPNFKTKSQEKKSSDGQLKKDHISFKQLTAEVKEMEKKLFSTMKASAKEANPIDTDRTKVSAKNATRADGFETTLSKSASVVNAIKSQNQRMKSFFIDFDILATVGRLDHLEVVHNIPMLLVFKMRDDRVTVELCLKGVRGLSAGSLLNKKVFFYVLNATGAIVRMHEIDTSINGHQPRFAYGGSPTGVQYDVIFDHEHDDILTGTFMELAVDVSPFTGVPDM